MHTLFYKTSTTILYVFRALHVYDQEVELYWCIWYRHSQLVAVRCTGWERTAEQFSLNLCTGQWNESIPLPLVLCLAYINVIFTFTLRLPSTIRLLRVLSFSGITSSILYIFHIYPLRVTCAAHLIILLGLITRQARVVWKVWRVLACLPSYCALCAADVS